MMVILHPFTTTMGLSQSKYCSRYMSLAAPLKDLYLAGPLPGLATCIVGLTLVSLYFLRVHRQTQRTTRIRGPQSPSWVFGFAKIVLDSTVTSELYEHWANEYGPVYRVPHVLGQSRIILWDPKAISHFFARDTWSYNQTPFNKISIQVTVCPFACFCSSKIMIYFPD
jgi:hypothetical protein